MDPQGLISAGRVRGADGGVFSCVRLLLAVYFRALSSLHLESPCSPDEDDGSGDQRRTELYRCIKREIILCDAGLHYPVPNHFFCK